MHDIPLIVHRKKMLNLHFNIEVHTHVFTDIFLARLQIGHFKSLMKCSCENGYKLHTDRRSCLPINRCLEDNGNCAHQCINVKDASYRCECNPGPSFTQFT